MIHNKLAPVAFLSYVQRVDRHDNGRLTQFRDKLSEEVSLTIGEDFYIFQDRKDILWGQSWDDRIVQSIDSSTFLIPIITPDYFNSEACRRELSLFLERERQLNRNDLILPVYYITTDKLKKPEKREADRLAQAIASHQWFDWRELRFEPFESPDVKRAFAKLATQMKDALDRAGALPRLSSVVEDLTASEEAGVSRSHLEGVVSQLIEMARSVGTDPRDAEEKIAKLAFLYAGGRYGMAYETITVDCNIYQDGSATVTREVDLTAYSNTEQLDTFLLLPEEPPHGEWEINPNLVEVFSLSKGKKVSLSQPSEEKDRLASVLNITPALEIGERMVYRMKEPLPPQFYTMKLTASMLGDGEDHYDYFGWNINRPTGEFSLRIHFPPGFGLPQDFQAEVRYASASGRPLTHFQYQEQLRSITPLLQKDDDNEGHILLLNVDYPMTGLIYVLKWLPRVDSTLLRSLIDTPSVRRLSSSGIPARLYHRLRQELVNCGPFATHQELRAIFIDSRIFAWREQLPRADTPIGRVEAVIDLLYNQMTSNRENALVLLLHVLSERLHPENDCRHRLKALAQELSNLSGGNIP